MSIRLPSYCFTCTTKVEVVEFMAKDKAFTATIKDRIKTNFTEDLIQDLYIIFLEMPEERVMSLNEQGTIIFFAYGILKKNFDSTNKNTKPNKYYRSFDGGESKAVEILNREFLTNAENMEREEDYMEKVQNITAAVSKLDFEDKNFWYKHRILTEYLNGDLTYKELADKLQIDIWNIRYAARTAKSQIKNELKRNGKL